MPIFYLYTNVDVPLTFVKRCSEEVSRLTNKPEAKVGVVVSDKLKMTFAGSSKNTRMLCGRKRGVVVVTMVCSMV